VRAGLGERSRPYRVFLRETIARAAPASEGKKKPTDESGLKTIFLEEKVVETGEIMLQRQIYV
jgi:hypothetical protein